MKEFYYDFLIHMTIEFLNPKYTCKNNNFNVVPLLGNNSSIKLYIFSILCILLISINTCIMPHVVFLPI